MKTIKRMIWVITLLGINYSYSQNAIPIGEPRIEYDITQKTVKILLSSSKLNMRDDFQLSDEYIIYYKGTTGSIEKEIKANNELEFLIDSDPLAQSANLPAIETDSLTRGKPFLVIRPQEPLKYGKYELHVKRKAVHIRTRYFEFIEPTILDFNGFTIMRSGTSEEVNSSSIALDGIKSWYGALIKFHDFIIYPEIRIGGISLKPDKKNKGYYRAANGWEKPIPEAINYYDSDLQIRKTGSTEFITIARNVIQFPKPRIVKIENKILSADEENFTFKLVASNTYGLPVIRYKNGDSENDNLIPSSDPGLAYITKKEDAFEFTIKLDKSNYSTAGKNISFQIENQNGDKSDLFSESFHLKSSGVNVKVNSREPLLEEYTSSVSFELGANEVPFNNSDSVWIIVDERELKFRNGRLSPSKKTIAGSITIPKDIYGSKTFKIKYNSKNGAESIGTFENIERIENLKISVIGAQKDGNEFKTSVNQKILLSTNYKDPNLEIEDNENRLRPYTISSNHFESSEIELSIKSTASIGQRFSFISKYGDHQIGSLNFRIDKGIVLDSILVTTEEENIITAEDESLTILVSNDLNIDYSNLTAELTDLSGTKLGETKNLIPKEGSYHFEFNLRSVSPGDLFYLRIKNPGSSDYEKKYYYRRKKLRDIVDISLGLTAGTFYFEKKELTDSTSLPASELINGINISFTGKPNSSFFRWQGGNFEKHPLSISANFSLNQGEELRPRLGLGINFFESLILGVDKGLTDYDDRLGIFLAATSSIGDIAGLFSGN